ncbi:MAG: hypothetical protein NTU63_02585 [Candidatus Pacearchaeota archaeon]|nr:hypothetical protein [Candidatus Pacearchaeota archaeon]
MNDEKTRTFIGKLIEKASAEKGFVPLSILCFYDIGCDINKCRSKDYDSIKKTGGCCKYYENKCKQRLEPLLEDIENNFEFLLKDIEKKVNGF